MPFVTLNVMAIRVIRHADVSKLMTFVDGDWQVCGRGVNRTIHEGMNDISNVKVFCAKKLHHATGGRWY